MEINNIFAKRWGLPMSGGCRQKVNFETMASFRQLHTKYCRYVI